MEFVHWVLSISPINVSLMVMLGVMVYMVHKWNKDPHKEFDLTQLLVDSTSGKIAIEKAGYIVAMLVGSWGFIALVQDGKMSEGYFTAYLGVFALSRAASMGIGALSQPKQSEQPEDKESK